MRVMMLVGICTFSAFYCGCTPAHKGSHEYSQHIEIITDSDRIEEFLSFEGIEHGDIWTPQGKDLEGLQPALKKYLRKYRSTSDEPWIDKKFILAHLQEYCLEYAGFIHEGTRYIICNMSLETDCRKWFDESQFITVNDGGCEYIRVIFNAGDKSIMRIECNGAA